MVDNWDTHHNFSKESNNLHYLLKIVILKRNLIYNIFLYMQCNPDNGILYLFDTYNETLFLRSWSKILNFFQT